MEIDQLVKQVGKVLNLAGASPGRAFAGNVGEVRYLITDNDHEGQVELLVDGELWLIDTDLVPYWEIVERIVGKLEIYIEIRV